MSQLSHPTLNEDTSYVREVSSTWNVVMETLDTLKSAVTPF